MPGHEQYHDIAQQDVGIDELGAVGVRPIPPRAKSPGLVSPEGIAIRSMRAGDHLPGRRFLDSSQLGWRHVLARAYTDPVQTDGFTTAATPDLLVFLNLSGDYRVQCRTSRGWRSARYRPGSVAITAPQTSSTLRWAADTTDPRRSLHIHLGRVGLESTADALGTKDLATRLPDALVLTDSFISACAAELWKTLNRPMSPLHAETIALAMTSHLLTHIDKGDVGARQTDASSHRSMSSSQFAAVRAFMIDHLANPIVLDDLAAVVHMSKFHFLRSFKATAGITPHQYLVNLRMQHAADLLRSTSLPVQSIATRCGYRSASQFASVFRRHHGALPTETRHAART